MTAQSRPEFGRRSHLVRFDYDRARGWQVRIPTWVSGTAEARFFPDRRHGGARGAFIAAKCFRDERFAAAGVTGLIRPYRIRDKRNQSGVVGVSLARRPHKNGKVYYAWTVLWNDRGTPHKKRFSVGVLGYEEAFRQACAWRSRKTGAPLHEGTVPQHSWKSEWLLQTREAKAEQIRKLQEAKAKEKARKMNGRILGRRNRSGITGVYLSRRPRNSGKTYYFWTVAWSEQGTQYKKRFSVDALGYEQAFRRACAWRGKKTGTPTYKGPAPSHRWKAESLRQAREAKAQEKVKAQTPAKPKKKPLKKATGQVFRPGQPAPVRRKARADKRKRLA